MNNNNCKNQYDLIKKIDEVKTREETSKLKSRKRVLHKQYLEQNR